MSAGWCPARPIEPVPGPVHRRVPATATAALALRSGDRGRVRRSARVALARHDGVGRGLDRRAADQADRRLALARDRAVVGVVQAAQRLVVGREVALRVVGASPEDVPGASRATRHEVAVIVLGAIDRERQRVGRRRAVALDVVALGIPRAADERPEPAALADERPLAALGAHLAGPLLGRRLLAGQRSALLVLGEHASTPGTGRCARAG